MTEMIVHQLDKIAYQPALDLQMTLVEQIKASRDFGNTAPAHLLLLEHDPPVITIGRRGREDDLLISPDDMTKLGLELHRSSRGGQVTYHGPGQLVGYVIIDLNTQSRDVHSHVAHLEETIIRTLSDFNLTGERLKGFTGVWLDAHGASPRKIAAIGVAVHRWITYHGFALNVRPNMSHFQTIVPCGITDKGVTSMEQELQRPITVSEVSAALLGHVADIFDVDIKKDAGTIIPPS